MTKLPRSYVQDGYSKNLEKVPPLTEGSKVKGGRNAPESQITERPPDPAPIKPKPSNSNDHGIN